jgi:hypothetical protein
MSPLLHIATIMKNAYTECGKLTSFFIWVYSYKKRKLACPTLYNYRLWKLQEGKLLQLTLTHVIQLLSLWFMSQLKKHSSHTKYHLR